MAERVQISHVCDASARAEARAMRAEAEVERLRAGLLACAKAAGEDVSDGPPTWPDIAEWAVRAVDELRDEYDQEWDRVTALVSEVLKHHDVGQRARLADAVADLQTFVLGRTSTHKQD